MLRYLKSAFFAGIDVPGIGRLPLNVLAVFGVAVLGFVEHPVWLLGAGLETAFLFLLAFNSRFQKVVDAQHLQLSDSHTKELEKKLIHSLRASLARRYEELGEQCEKMLALYEAEGNDEFALETNRNTFENLRWIYLKLLVAKENLVSHSDEESEESLKNKISDIERELAHLPESDNLAKSKAATLSILQQRVELLHGREKSLKEIDSDLTRIEEQISLIMDNARLHEKSPAITAELDLATNLASGSLFGGAENMVAAIDSKHAQTNSARSAQETA